ncbi:MAG: molecular chaperone TorD family protein [Candidatus Rokubacteria bacterium]|nr:molecular chaperone TorD family protein [Candidatus Rokubacteria bacterium]
MSGRNGLVGLPELARVRSRLYRLLAAGFSPPTRAEVRRLARRGALPARGALARVVPALGGVLAALGSCLAGWRRRDPARVLEELKGDYHRLFVGPYHLEAPPYESCYRGRGGAVMGEAAVEVLQSYGEAGLALHPDVRNPPDHIALELHFLGLLAREEAALWRRKSPERLGSCLRRQQSFLSDHLALWIAPFSERVQEADGSRFYGPLAAATADYVAADLALLGALREAVP